MKGKLTMLLNTLAEIETKGDGTLKNGSVLTTRSADDCRM